MTRRNKMGAVKVVDTVGTQECHFDSKAEWRYALWLESERKAGRIVSWRHHPSPFYLFGEQDKPVCKMAPDFLVQRVDGAWEYHEVKGMATAAWRLKRALYEQAYNDPYVVIDAGEPGDVASGKPPELFDTRRARKAARKRERGRK